MATVSVGRTVVDVLEAEGVRFFFGLPDFSSIAGACGCRGERAEDTGEVDAAVAAALEANDAGIQAVLDLAVAPVCLPGSLEYFAHYSREVGVPVHADA